ncbi:MAG: SHOCT domain-containing protein [Candidatus Tenebribacter burtonii]|nr:SHOCT domain-containing protein [Candidatus Tenebribacter burtonii]
MRGGILVIGLILLVFGMFLFFNGSNMTGEFDRLNTGDIPWGELIKLHPDAYSRYNSGQSQVMLGGIIGVVGFIICIAGIFMPYNKELKREKTEPNTKPIKTELKQEENEAIDILRMRFVKGEITDKEYEKMKKKLED